MEVISRGAEAVLYRNGDFLIKKRVPKGYRIKEIDEKIRRLRTRSEAKLLQKLDFVPTVFSFDDTTMEITMEFIDGDVLRDVLDSFEGKERKDVCFTIGKKISQMHDMDIIHGDLTTSNILLKCGMLYFIDFGLGFVSQRIEDKATDLRLLRQALESKHYRVFDQCYRFILEGYKKSRHSSEVLSWLEHKVEKRGRYKRKQH